MRLTPDALATKPTFVYLPFHLLCLEHKRITKRRERLRKEKRKSQGSAVLKQSPPPEKVYVCVDIPFGKFQ